MDREETGCQLWCWLGTLFIELYSKKELPQCGSSLNPHPEMFQQQALKATFSGSSWQLLRSYLFCPCYKAEFLGKTTILATIFKNLPCGRWLLHILRKLIHWRCSSYNYWSLGIILSDGDTAVKKETQIPVIMESTSQSTQPATRANWNIKLKNNTYIIIDFIAGCTDKKCIVKPRRIPLSLCFAIYLTSAVSGDKMGCL